MVLSVHSPPPAELARERLRVPLRININKTTPQDAWKRERVYERSLMGGRAHDDIVFNSSIIARTARENQSEASRGDPSLIRQCEPDRSAASETKRAHDCCPQSNS